MMTNALAYLLETIFNLFVLAALLRFYMQILRAPFRNPFAVFVVALTDFAVKPLRRIIPGLGGYDWASLIVAWLVELLLLVLLYAIAYQAVPGSTLPALLFLAFIKLIRLSIYLLIGVVIVQAILSWVSPYHPMMPFFDTLTRPFLKPVRSILPTIGGVDLSPLVLLIVCQLILMVPVTWLEAQTSSLLFRPLPG
jgi:YggT family protein